MESNSGSGLDLQDGISHRAAKPEWVESSFRIRSDLQDGLSHRAAKRSGWHQVQDQVLILKTVFHIGRRSRNDTTLTLVITNSQSASFDRILVN
jgi:hypothetical protein